MNIQELVDTLRRQHVPGGTLDVVYLRLGNEGFVDGKIVRGAIDVLEQKMILAASGINETNDLERLGILLLTSKINL